jgi:pyrroline-5-carboxylate reductase
MGYTLCVLGVRARTSRVSIADSDPPVLGCGTMGIAITSGVLASLHSRSPLLHGLNSDRPKWESHTPGTSTPAVAENGNGDEPRLPSRFIACVQREESARRLREKFSAVLGGDAVEVTVGENVSAVQQSDVVLLWYARTHASLIYSSDV